MNKSRVSTAATLARVRAYGAAVMTVFVLAICGDGRPAAAQEPPSAPYIVTFTDRIPAFQGGYGDERAHANPASWRYVDLRIVSTVQALESELGFRAEHVYSAAVRGFSARLTQEMLHKLRQLPFVESIELDGMSSRLADVEPGALDSLEDYLASRGARTSDAARPAMYVVDAGVHGLNPGGKPIDHVDVTGSAAHCAPSRHYTGPVAAAALRSAFVGVPTGDPVTALDTQPCEAGIIWNSSVLKAIDWLTAEAGRPAVVNVRVGGSTSAILDDAIRRSADRGIEYLMVDGDQAADLCSTSPQSAGTHDGVLLITASTSTAGEGALPSVGSCVDIRLQNSEIVAPDAQTAVGTPSSILTPEPAPTATSAASVAEPLNEQFATTATWTPGAAARNVRVVFDASPDLTDLASLVHSTTSAWPSSREKVWALYYWTHILKRQTSPIVLHGFEVTDPIRNFVDYGFTMCSTISGINQTLFEAIGLRHQYWDICNHTVSNVEYDGAFHMVDSSMSHLVTKDDGVTLASVEEAAADSARLVRLRSLYSTSPNGFLTGSDTVRNLSDFVSPSGSVVPGFANAFCANGLKLRDYYYNWSSGHRYVLHLRDNESYTRHYRRLGSTRDFWVGSEDVGSPDPGRTFEIDPEDRFGLRGNGVWSFSPSLSSAQWREAAYRSANITSAAAGGLRPDVPQHPAEVVYKVQAGNAIASQRIEADFVRVDPLASATLSLSTNHGATWTEVASIGSAVGVVPIVVSLRDQVNGVYETLIRIQMLSQSGAPDGIAMTRFAMQTVTQVNTKALPKLNVGRNEISVGIGEQSDSIVLWPDLRADFWRRDVADFANIASQPASIPRTYTAVVYPAVLSADAYLTYRIQAPTDITRVVYGGRLYNPEPGSFIDFLHSFDGGTTWIRSFRLSDTAKPYDVIHYETVTAIPTGVRSVLVKFLMHTTGTSAGRASGLYSARIEVNHRPQLVGVPPIDVTVRWKEVQADRSTVARSHTQRVSAFPFRYVINVGGLDHPIMESITLSADPGAAIPPFGYSDGIDVGGQKYLYRKQTVGTNVAEGKPYTFSRPPSAFQSSAGAGDVRILTDGVVGAPASGGIAYWWGQCWTAGQNLDLQIDLGQSRPVGAFRAHLFGYPFWDALKGEVQDRIEVLTSLDGVAFVSRGLLQTSLWRKDVPINHMLPDDEKATAWNFERVLASPVSARYVRYQVSPNRILCASELQVLDRIEYQPFDLRLAAVEPTPSDPPAAPSALTAARLSATHVDLRWSDNASSEAGFVIERATNGSGFGLVATVGQDAVSYSDTTAASGSSHAYRVAAYNANGVSPYSNTVTIAPVTTLPAPWMSSDVGAVGTAGRASHAAGTFELIAGGTLIFDAADAFHFVHQRLTGDGDIVARVDGIEKPADATAALAGVMFRESLSAGARHAALIITTEGKAKFRRRTVTGGATDSDGPSAGTTFVPKWLKLSRRGSTFTAYLSGDGLAWTPIHTPQSVTLPVTVEVGLVALRSGGTGLARVLFSSVSVSAGVVPGLPAGWTATDVGVPAGGQSSYADGTYRLQVAGLDLWSGTDAFHFVSRSLIGDGEIVAQLDGLINPAGSSFTLGGVMIRESLADNARHASMILTTQGKAKFRRRLSVGDTTLSDGPSTGTTFPPRWLKLRRTGNNFTAFISSDGLAWQQVHTAESIVMAPTVYIGLVGLRNGGTAQGDVTLSNVIVR